MPLLPERGMLHVDAVDGRIVYVEVLCRPPLRRASPEPAADAEAEHADS
ncbi:hypothetical protein [Streptomyces sp. NBC_01264]|nr:hypothetical protein [Streptomyces sp. NBC_01264]MCX4778264.1 hypothetical protein [Streptomyces sp. NBC_01264]